MSVITRLDKLYIRNAIKTVSFYCTTTTQDDTEFRVLNLKHVRNVRPMRRPQKRPEVQPPRTAEMSVEQDWGSVWPGARTFHPATVPLPIRQGYRKVGVAPDKFANAELMKIPNFLHLTPPVIKRQCEALKRFCTAWPKELDMTDEQCEKHFPVEVTRSSYCHSSPTIRDPLARIVTVHFKLDNLGLNNRARDKFLRLAGERYNETTGLVSIVADRCPSRKQNYDYVMYLLTALYHESWKIESWEALKSDADMEVYNWSDSPSQKSIEAIFKKPVKEIAHIEEYSNSLLFLMNEGENEYSVEKYGEAVRKLLQLPE